MPRISLMLVAACGALLTGCASAGWHTYANQPHDQQLAANGQLALICRNQAATGTRMIKRECHTQQEWDSMANDSMTQFNQDAARSLPMTDPGSASGR